MGAFAIIQRSPGGGSCYGIDIGRSTFILQPGGVTAVVAALAHETGVSGAAAIKLGAVVRRALAQTDGRFALVNLPEKRRARKAVRP